ncbi:unnamed protein product [Darwinula stevensoni]|uniref:Kringle domain-containing protein n=1 Tax=Darwinula stevensoni TaxID=69355 RepID=A0A7R9ADS5_9CRUS|nr:unnamed protein product [Darwinula stevensoni]CAG0901595.1 unnamed protein product [Darwinula stevensoni]
MDPEKTHLRHYQIRVRPEALSGCSSGEYQVKGQRYENVTLESQEPTVRTCTIICVMQIPSPCYAFNYRETDRSCQLILNGMSRLVGADGFQSYVQSEKIHKYPECRLTEKGREYAGRVSATESGRNCLNWRDYPYGRPEDFSDVLITDDKSIDYGIPLGREFIYDFQTFYDHDEVSRRDLSYEAHFRNRDSKTHLNYCRNPSGRERPWCFVSDPKIQWEYCDIPMCTDPVPPECKVTQFGSEYTGRKDTTIAGDPCLPWRNLENIENLLPAFPDPDRVDAHHNFCRNPRTPYHENLYEVNAAPWCIFKNASDIISWGFCDIPSCAPTSLGDSAGTGVYPECRLSQSGKEYAGSENKTESGKPCLPWENNEAGLAWDFYPQSEFAHFYFLVQFTEEERNTKHNHCRNPGVHRERPWCFVADNETKWEYCDIPFCRDRNPPECKLSESGLEYVGKRNVTISGFLCLPWLSLFKEDEIPLTHFSDEVDGKHAFCRSPQNRLKEYYGPWCYINFDGDGEFCDVPYCPTDDRLECDVRVGGHCISESFRSRSFFWPSDGNFTIGRLKRLDACCFPGPLECKTDATGRSYVGTKNSTRKGHKCLPWVSRSALQQRYAIWDLSYKNEDYEGENYRFVMDDLHPRHNFCRNPIGDENGPWCFKTDGLGRDYCDIPLCT